MTPQEWITLTKPARRDAWQRMTADERLELWQLLAATTPGYGLPYPVDYNDPADSPLAFRELAIATDNGLVGLNNSKAPVVHSHPEYAPAGHNHDGRYAPAAHGHGANEVRSVNMGTINAGDEKISPPLPKAGDQVPVSAICVAPSSTYLLPALFLDSATQWRLKVRNTTGSTNHTNVTFYCLLVRNG